MPPQPLPPPPSNMMMGGGESPSVSGAPAPPIPNNPQVQQGPNAFMRPGAGGPSPTPPTQEALIDAAQKAGYINSMLRDLLGKPNISPRDVINGVGHLVSEQIMDVPMAAKYLSDLPISGDQVRQWLTQHFMASSANLHAIGTMIQQSAQAPQGPPQGMPPQGPPPMNGPMMGPPPNQRPPNLMQTGAPTPNG